MARRPLILVTSSHQSSGAEMLDDSISVSHRYLDAVLDHGGLPVAMPLSADARVLADLVDRCDGILLSGGDDIEPRLHRPEIAAKLRNKCAIAVPVRDLMELLLIKEIFRNPLPVLAICRGHQIFNIALGGTLYVDLPSERPDGLNHSQLDRRCDPAHPVALSAGSLLARLTHRRSLGVNSTHHQAIDQLAAPFVPTAISPDGVIEAMEFRPADRGLLPWFASVQFHPERLYDRYREHRPLFRAFINEAARSKRK